MAQSNKQLTAEEVFRAREKNQKRRYKRKEAVFHAKEEAASALLEITSTGGKKKDVMPLEEATKGSWVPIVQDETLNCFGPNGEWVTIDDPPDWDKEELNVDWPWERVPSKLLTQAPYALNEHNFDAGFFQLPQEVQTSPLFNIPRGMEAPILQLLFQYHSCASKFAATCQSAFNMVAANIHHWDFTRCEYNGCDEDPSSRSVSPCSVGKIVVVSQFRVRIWKGENFPCEMWSLQRMTHAFVNFAEHFETLHLHRIPFLTTRLLEMVVPLMKKLKVLGIFRCELIHVGDTEKLLEIVRKYRKYGSGNTHRVKLDFYPRFHIGPRNNPVPGGKASYGVTWDNFILDSRLAIWALLMRILPQAKKQEVDLTGKDSAFRLWLEQSPCWRVEDTIEAIERGDDGARLAVQVNYPKTRGKAGKLAWDESHWLINKFHCRTCKQDVLGVFFDFEEYTERAYFSDHTYEMLCLGCKLTMHLGFENDHRKTQKHHMVEGWLGDPKIAVKDDDLEKALSNEAKKRSAKYTSRYERDRKEYEAAHEGEEEMQKPRVKSQKCSPSINEREWHGYW